MSIDSIRFWGRYSSLIRSSGLFDSQWYLDTNLDVKKSKTDPLTHYVRYGAEEGRNPSRLFNTSFYKRQASIGDKNPLLHYILVGERIGLSPSALFDSRWYQHKYPDILDSGVSPLRHFTLFGSKEGRDPNPLFDTDWFKVEHTTLNFEGHDLFAYYLDRWREDNLKPSWLFDPAWYLSRYEDVAAAGLDPLSHYLEYGGLEGRSPHPLFEASIYLAKYPDVASSKVNPLAHYLHHGRFEARNINRYFDAAWYLTTYPDVEKAGADPVKHYIENGAFEGRNPSPLFDSSWYLEANPDVALAGINPLRHFLSTDEQQRTGPVDSHAMYRNWRVRLAERNVAEKAEISKHISVLPWKPMFAIVCLKDQSQDGGSHILKDQPYPDWFSVNAAALSQEEARPDYYIFVASVDCLDWRSLYEFASAIIAQEQPDILYCDCDYTSSSGEPRSPFIKPDWSPDYLETFNYIGYSGCFSSKIVNEEWFTSASYYDFVLRATEGDRKVHHIRQVLYHEKSEQRVIETPSEATHALQRRLLRTGRVGEIKELRTPGTYQVSISSLNSSLVSIVIPTAGKTIQVGERHIDLVLNLIEKIVENSTYRYLEFIVVHNNDLDERQLVQLAALGVKMKAYAEPVFNVSKKLNIGANLASGEIMLLMNDDLEPLTNNWIEVMLAELEKEWVGVVGAKLLFPNGSIQHAGVILKDGNPDHVRKFYPQDDEGYFGSTIANRNYCAVTGACMMTRTALYHEVGGYNEELAISYNDVDFCFRVREKGLSIVYAAHAELTHFESQSRVPKLDPSEASYFKSRWAASLSRDEFYNTEFLSKDPPNFSVKLSRRFI